MILHFAHKPIGPGTAVLSIQGNIHCGPECLRLEQEVDKLIAAQSTRVILDMAGVTHADSAAIGAMVRCLTKLKAKGGAMRVAAAQPMIVYSLKLTKLDRLIEMFPNVEEAATGFTAPTPGSAPPPAA